MNHSSAGNRNPVVIPFQVAVVFIHHYPAFLPTLSSCLTASSCTTIRGHEINWIGYGLDERGSIAGRGRDILLFATASRPALGSPSPLPHRYRGTFSSGVKRLVCEVDHAPPSSARIKDAWSYTSTPPSFFMMWWTCVTSTTKKINFPSVL